MPTGDVVRIDHPLLAGMEEEHMRTLAACAWGDRFEEGEYLFRVGEKANRCFLISGGRLALELDGGERGIIRIATLREGDVAGFSWIFPPHRWKWDGRVVEPVEATVLDGEALRVAKAQNHDLGYDLLLRFSAVISSRLQATRLQIMDVYGDHG
jgi:CRP-like cAMP-binding protein